MKEKIIIRVISRLSLTLLGLFLNILLLVKFNVESVGIIAFSTSFIGLFTLFINLGFSSICIQHNADENYPEFFSAYFFMNSLLSVINFAPLFFLIFLLDLELLVQGYLLLQSISILLTNLANPLTINLESKKKFIKTEIMNFCTNILKDFLLIYFIFNFEAFEIPLLFLGDIHIIVSLVQILFVFIVSKGELIISRINFDVLKILLKDTKPLILSTVISTSINSIGSILIDLSFGHEALAYYYFAQTYIIEILLLISVQFHQIFLTYLPKMFKEKQYVKIQQLCNLVERLSSIFFIPIILILFLNGSLLFDIFLPKYKNSINLLYILIFIPYMAGISRPYLASIIPSGNQKLFAQVRIYQSIVLIFLTIILVPSEFFMFRMLGMGAIGFSFIFISSWIFDSIFFRIFLFRKYGIKSYFKIYIHIILGFISFVLILILSNFILKSLLGENLIFVFVSSAVAIGTYLIGLIILNELKRNDLILILNLLRISNYKESLLDEIRK